MGTEAELFELERAFWGAAGDGDFYRRHFADDGLCVFPMGVMGKPATVEAVEHAAPWLDVELEDTAVLDLSPDVAAVVYSATARRAADRSAYSVRVSSVYVRRNHEWVLALHQQTPLD